MADSQFHFIADLLRASPESLTNDSSLLENALQKLTDLSKDSIHLTPLTIAPLIRLIATAPDSLVGHFLGTTLKVILDDDNKDRASEHLASISDRIALGIKAFLARGGGTPKSSSSTPTNIENNPDGDVAEPPAKKRRKIPTSSRSSQQRSRCWARDRKVCVITSSPDNLEVAHILPFSIGVSKKSRPSSSRAAPAPLDDYFWDFVGMFLGLDNTAKLKSRFEQLDVVENMLLVDPNVHKYFGAGRFCLVPQLTLDDEFSFNPSTTLEVIENPYLPLLPSPVNRPPIVQRDNRLPPSSLPWNPNYCQIPFTTNFSHYRAYPRRRHYHNQNRVTINTPAPAPSATGPSCHHLAYHRSKRWC